MRPSRDGRQIGSLGFDTNAIYVEFLSSNGGGTTLERIDR